MKNGKMMLLLAFCLLATAAPLLAHCEIPCGIYGDEARFAAIAEDLTTIEKAMKQISALAGQSDAQSANQLARWVANKEEHANRIQHVVSQYFMTQRLKEVEEGDEAMGRIYREAGALAQDAPGGHEVQADGGCGAGGEDAGLIARV